MSYSTGCGYSNSGGYISGLEAVVGGYSSASRGYSSGRSSIDYMIAAESLSFEPAQIYGISGVRKEVYADSYRSTKRLSETYNHVMDDFLDPARPQSTFIGEASEVKEFVEEAFTKLTGNKFPDDLKLNIVDSEEMKKLHPSNVLGFAINRKRFGMVSEIFVKKDMLDKMMLTVGHELGHVLTKRLPHDRDEEAKAFAFSLSWMKIIKQENIANLATSIRLDTPAKNGLHDVALDFVLKLVRRGRDVFSVYNDLVNGLLEVKA